MSKRIRDRLREVREERGARILLALISEVVDVAMVGI